MSEDSLTLKDLGYNEYLERPLIPLKEEWSALSFDSLLEPRAITEEQIDKSLIDRLES